MANAEGSVEEVNLVPPEPANVEGLADEANVPPKSTDVDGSAEEVNVVQLKSAEEEGSDEEANVVQVDPANVDDSAEEANVVQREPADEEANVVQREPADEEVNVVQREPADEGSRPSSLETADGEPDSRAHEDGAVAEEPQRMNFEDVHRRVPAGPPLQDDVPGQHILAAVQGMMVQLRQSIDSFQAATANVKRAAQAMEVCLGVAPFGGNPAADPV